MRDQTGGGTTVNIIAVIMQICWQVLQICSRSLRCTSWCRYHSALSLYMDGRYAMNQTVINTIFPGSSKNSVRSVAKKAGLAPPIDIYSLFQSQCPVIGGTPGHAVNSTDTFCDWIGSGGKDGCHPDDTGYGQLAVAVKSAITRHDHELGV